MAKNDLGMGELLDLLKTHPELISALVFDHESIKRLLKSKAARQLLQGVDAKAFLTSVAGPEEGGPIALCLERTKVLCPKHSRIPAPCPGHSKLGVGRAKRR